MNVRLSIPLLVIGFVAGSEAFAGVRVDLQQIAVGKSVTVCSDGYSGCFGGQPGVDFVEAALPSVSGPSYELAGPIGASANSTSGQLRAHASSPEAGDLEEATARFGDLLIFKVSGFAPSSVTFRGWLEGTVADAIEGTGGAFGYLSLDASSTAYSTGTFLSPNFGSYCVDTQPPLTPGSFCATGTSVARQVSLTVPLAAGESSLRFEAVLGARVGRGAQADFSNTASIWIDMPENVSFVPSTAGFLSQASPVPEPAQLWLLLVGLSVIALRAGPLRTA